MGPNVDDWSEKLYYQTGIAVVHDFFAAELLERLRQNCQQQPKRKIEYKLEPPKNFPSPIDEAALEVQRFFELPEGMLNAAVSKRYDEVEASGAYEWHRDPENFHGHLFLCSLGGVATFGVYNVNNVFGPHARLIECTPNTVIAYPQPDGFDFNYLHRVTPPEPEFGTRYFLFLGHSCSEACAKVETTGDQSEILTTGSSSQLEV